MGGWWDGRRVGRKGRRSSCGLGVHVCGGVGVRGRVSRRGGWVDRCQGGLGRRAWGCMVPSPSVLKDKMDGAPRTSHVRASFCQKLADPRTGVASHPAEETGRGSEAAFGGQPVPSSRALHVAHGHEWAGARRSGCRWRVFACGPPGVDGGIGRDRKEKKVMSIHRSRKYEGKKEARAVS